MLYLHQDLELSSTEIVFIMTLPCSSLISFGKQMTVFVGQIEDQGVKTYILVSSFFKGDFMWGHKLAWRSWNYANVSIFRLHVAVSVCINRSGFCFCFCLFVCFYFCLFVFIFASNWNSSGHPHSLFTNEEQKKVGSWHTTNLCHTWWPCSCMHACVRACAHTHSPPTHTHTHMHVIMCSHMLWGSLSFQMLLMKILCCCSS